MSEYINFFIKGTDRYYPIGVYSRSNPEYQYFKDYCDYEKVTAIDESVTISIYNKVKKEIDNYNKMIEHYKMMIDSIKHMEGPLDERVERIWEFQSDIHSTEAEIEDLKRFLGFIDFLSGIFDVAKNFVYEESLKSIDCDRYVYVGIETGYVITDDMVEEKINE